MREVILERAAVRRKGLVVGWVEMERVLVRHDHADVGVGLVRVHGALDPLREAHGLDRRAEPACWRFEKAFEERLDARQDPHRGRS